MNKEHTTLAYNNSLAEKLNDYSIDPVLAIDTSWKIIACNKRAALGSGYRKEDMIGKHLLGIFPQIRQDEQMMSAITSALLGHPTILSRSNRGLFNMQSTEDHFIPLKDEEGNIFGILNISRDAGNGIDMEKRLHTLEAALKKKCMQLEEANNELASFAQVASQQIKEPVKFV